LFAAAFPAGALISGDEELWKARVAQALHGGADLAEHNLRHLMLGIAPGVSFTRQEQRSRKVAAIFSADLPKLRCASLDELNHANLCSKPFTRPDLASKNTQANRLFLEKPFGAALFHPCCGGHDCGFLEELSARSP
jgi:hypothetical protein